MKDESEIRRCLSAGKCVSYEDDCNVSIYENEGVQVVFSGSKNNPVIITVLTKRVEFDKKVERMSQSNEQYKNKQKVIKERKDKNKERMKRKKNKSELMI